MELIKKCRGQLIFTAVLLLMLLAMPFEDYIEDEYDYEDMNFPDEFVHDIDTDGGVIDVPSGLGECVLYSNDVYLPSGTYTSCFTVDAEGGDVTVEIYEPDYLNDDNTTGRVIASSVIETGGESVNLEFAIEGDVTRVIFRVTSGYDMVFRGIYIISGRNIYKDPYIYAAILLAASGILLFVRSRKRVRMEVLLLLAGAALWASIPVSFNWLYYGHDLPYHYARLFCLSEDLFSSQLPVMIHSSMYRGFGYMIPVFYPETFLLPFALLISLGLSPIGGYRLLVIGINLATAGVGYYSFSRLMCSRKLGAVTALFYTLAAYRLMNLYTRAAIGEALASIFLPLLILGMVQIIYGKSEKWFTAALAVTAVFQSHMISTELSLGFCVLAVLFGIKRFWREHKRFWNLLKAAACTVLLNIWAIVPFLDLMGYPLSVYTDTRNLEGYSVYPAQFLDTEITNAAGEALPTSSITGEMPYAVGIALLLGCALFIVICLRKDKPFTDRIMRLGKASLILGAVSVYASSTLFPWAALQRISIINSLVSGIQFAYRFLIFATVFLCIPAALGVYGFFKDAGMRRMLLLGSTLLMILSSGSYFSSFENDSSVYAKWDNQYNYVRSADTLYLITDDFEDYSYNKLTTQETAFNASEGVTLTEVSRNETDACFTYEITETSSEGYYVDVPYFYYPYYSVYDDEGNRLETSNSGELLRLRVTLPDDKSEGTIYISFRIPAYCRAAEAVSAVTVLGIVGYALLKKKGKVVRTQAK